MKRNATLLFSLLLICSFAAYAVKPKMRSRRDRTPNNAPAKVLEPKVMEPTPVCSEEEKQQVTEFLSTYVQRYQKKLSDQYLFNCYLFISIKNQRMYHVVNNTIVRSWHISGSKNGVGNKYGSNQTPVGLHTIVEKFGYGAPKGGLFVERRFSGKVSKIHKEKYCVGSDDVTTRVMWLQGEEPGVNKGGKIDSYHRFIYIHGTPEEGLIGKPSSEGCIRMKNSEVMDLFNFAYVGMKVLILPE